MLSKLRWRIVFGAILLFPLIILTRIGYAQDIDPIDMMIVIDNSCSMFSEDERLEAECVQYEGNDENKLRNIGADIFFASLGLASPFEENYQIGIVSFGDPAVLIEPLQPIQRSEFARTIANIRPQYNTNIVSALTLSYQELNESPRRISSNKPAIVLVTDGVPSLQGGIIPDNADIEALVQENPTIPVFIMLIQNEASKEAYVEYVNFWNSLRDRYENVFVNEVNDIDQLDTTYNQIMGQLQGTSSGTGMPIKANVPQSILINPFVQQITIKVINKIGAEESTLTITDANDQIVTSDQPGVTHFKEADNPIEVYVIDKERLNLEGKSAIWTVQSDHAIRVLLDSGGAYRIDLIRPEKGLTSLSNVYLATNRVSPRDDVSFQFRLLDGDDTPILEPQEIYGDVLAPDGTRSEWLISSGLQPTEEGVYEVEYNLGAFVSESEIGRFCFRLNAGQAFTDVGGNPIGDKRIPIASAQLLVDVGRGPYIEKLAPMTVFCDGRGENLIEVTIGDYEFGLADSMQVRVLGADSQVDLANNNDGTFSGDVVALCELLQSRAECSTTETVTFSVRLAAQNKDGAPLRINLQSLAVSAESTLCTATPPPPTATPLPPTPTPTPLPDTDQDGGVDPVDRCRTWAGLEVLGYCPVWIVPIVLVIVAAILLFFWKAVFPRIWIRTPWGRPPEAYLMFCGENRPKIIKNLAHIGKDTRTRHIKIGSDSRKVQIVDKYLQPIEFIVERQGERIIVLDTKKGGRPKQLNPRGSVLRMATSDPNTRLHIGLNRDKVASSYQ